MIPISEIHYVPGFRENTSDIVRLAEFLKRNMNCHASRARDEPARHREGGKKNNKWPAVVSRNGQSDTCLRPRGCSNFKQAFSSRPINIADGIAIDI